MTSEEKQAVQRLIEAARPFLSEAVVDVTDGTIPLTNELEAAIEAAEELVKQ